MNYFKDIDNLTALQEKRIKLLQSYPGDARLINSAFMQAKDAILGSRGAGGQTRRKPRRITYKVEIIQDVEPYAELRGDCVYVSAPAYPIFDADYTGGQIPLPKVTASATMAVFLPPLTPVPVFSFT